jgi:hypothetical protein
MCRMGPHASSYHRRPTAGVPKIRGKDGTISLVWLHGDDLRRGKESEEENGCIPDVCTAVDDTRDVWQSCQGSRPIVLPLDEDLTKDFYVRRAIPPHNGLPPPGKVNPPKPRMMAARMASPTYHHVLQGRHETDMRNERDHTSHAAPTASGPPHESLHE